MVADRARYAARTADQREARLQRMSNSTAVAYQRGYKHTTLLCTSSRKIYILSVGLATGIKMYLDTVSYENSRVCCDRECCIFDHVLESLIFQSLHAKAHAA